MSRRLASDGWLDTRRYTDTWDPLAPWWHIGDPQNLVLLPRVV
ncbi:MAG: hypothetical protein ABI862_13930 [Ilumatobacteraceae bacterium]